MQLQVKAIDGLFRIVDEQGKIALNTRTGQPLDNGGKTNNQTAERQAQHIMEGMNRAKK